MNERRRDAVGLGGVLEGLVVLETAGQTLEEVLLVLGQSQPQEELQLGLYGPARLSGGLLPR